MMTVEMFPRKADRKRQSEFSEVRCLRASPGRNIFMSRLLFLFYFWKLKNFHSSNTREKLLGGSAELDLVVYPVGQVWPLAFPALAESVPGGDPLHVLGQAQGPQDVHGSWRHRRGGRSQGNKAETASEQDKVG